MDTPFVNGRRLLPRALRHSKFVRDFGARLFVRLLSNEDRVRLEFPPDLFQRGIMIAPGLFELRLQVRTRTLCRSPRSFGGVDAGL